MPNASPFGISVGATTNNVFVGYGPFKDEPRFGNTTSHYNHVVDFSSRGPSIIGDPKPDVMSIGAHGFTPSNVLKPKKIQRMNLFHYLVEQVWPHLLFQAVLQYLWKE